MGSISPLVIVGCVVICLGEILQIVGLATRSWIVGDTKLSEGINSGLWKYCTSLTCEEIEDVPFLWDKIADDVKAVRAMIIIGMVCGLVGTVVVVLMLALAMMDKAVQNLFAIVCLVSTIAAFIFTIIGVIIFGANVYDDFKDFAKLGFSFALCIVGGILLPVGGGLAFAGGSGLNGGVGAA